MYEDYFISTCDAEAMYPNVKTEEGLTFLIAARDAHIFKVRLNWPRKQLLLAIKLILKCNVFQFDHTYFRKIGAGAMINPFTCIWAVANFAFVENLFWKANTKIIC